MGASHHTFGSLCVREFMTKYVQYAHEAVRKDVLASLMIEEFGSVSALIDVLHSNHLIRVPVIDGEETLLGIVARRDILRTYLGTPD